MIDQNVIVTGRAQHAVNGLAELRVLRIECVICLRFRSCHSHVEVQPHDFHSRRLQKE